MVGRGNDAEDGGAIVLAAVRGLAEDLGTKGIKLKEITLSFYNPTLSAAVQLVTQMPEVLEDPQDTEPDYPGVQGVFVLLGEEAEDV